MKKKKLLNNFLLCVVIAMSVCGIAACASKPESVTVEQIIEANDRQKVIEEYGNLQIKAVGKKYKVYFVDEANTVPDIVMNHINNL